MRTITKHTKDLLEKGKRLTKFDLSYEIGRNNVFSPLSISYEHFKREELVNEFNKIYNLSIK